MKIQFTPQLNFKHVSKNQSQSRPQADYNNKSYAYNPIAYKDYNISFGERLFRSPENFYEQDFNEENMPKSLHKYIYESPDSDFRKTIPPAQAMKEVFGKINYAKDLDAVKKMFPDEPLFKNLTSTPHRKSREGLLGMINLIKDDPAYAGKTIFKNGNNDLGMYILKKIYIEGKTLKEINKDFAKDVSVYFKSYDIKPQDYNAFGIKFPNNSFWHSFTATREDFPYVYIPKGSQQAHSTSKHTNSSHTTVKRTEKNKFADVKEWEVEKLADALIKGNGSKSETEKQIKKRGVQNKDSMNFVAQYMGEINSVVLEKLHISDDMKDYFEHYNDLTKSQREKFDEYMKNPYINDLRSKVMSSTIRFFFDVYGVDGNNDDFKELLEYAHNIKPERIKRNLEHDRLQAEYEEALGIFNEDIETTPKNEVVTSAEEIQNEDIDIENLKPQTGNLNKYTFKTNDEPIIVYSTPQFLLKEALRNFTDIMPDAFAQKMLDFYTSHPLCTEDYAFTMFADNMELGDEETPVSIKHDDRFMSNQKTDEVTNKIYVDFNRKYTTEENAAQQAMVDLYIKATGDLPIKTFNSTCFGLGELYRKLSAESKELLLKNKDLVNQKYNFYRKPLSRSEINKLSNELLNQARNYDKNTSIINPNGGLSGVIDGITVLKLILNSDNKRNYRDFLKKDFDNFLEYYGGAARFLLDDTAPDKYKKAQFERIMCFYTISSLPELYKYVKMDIQTMNYIKKTNPEIYYKLIQNKIK